MTNTMRRLATPLITLAAFAAGVGLAHQPNPAPAPQAAPTAQIELAGYHSKHVRKVALPPVGYVITHSGRKVPLLNYQGCFTLREKDIKAGRWTSPNDKWTFCDMTHREEWLYPPS